MVIGELLVSPTPLSALKTSPAKCKLLSLISALKKRNLVRGLESYSTHHAAND